MVFFPDGGRFRLVPLFDFLEVFNIVDSFSPYGEDIFDSWVKEPFNRKSVKDNLFVASS